MNRKITIEQLSTADDDSFLVALAGLYAHSEWVIRRVARARPFSSPAALLQALWHCVADASEDEQLAVIRAHPDLTDSAATRDGLAGGCHLGALLTSDLDRDSVSATLRADGVAPRRTDAPSGPLNDDAARIDALREKVIAENLAYRKRFGFPFILAAHHIDRSGASVLGALDEAGAMTDILDTLQRRLRSQRRDELAEAVRQVNRIAELRLNHLLGRQVFHGREVMRWCEALAAHSDDDSIGAGGCVPAMLTCTYLTPAHHACADLIATWMRRAGMEAHIDIFGNVIGRYRSSVVGARSLITGSHYDTVRNGGKYDGRIGILLPITLIAEMHRRGERFPFDIDVIAFAEEEGVRFKTSFLGSSVFTGNIDASVLARIDENGASLREAILANARRLAKTDATRQSMPSSRIETSAPTTPADDESLLQQALRDGKRDPSTVLAFLEVHIEQGPVLFTEQLPVGVVTAISGSKRYLVHLTGIAGHAGAMPMDLRRDAAAAAAEITLYVEQRCSGVPSLVGTVGRLEVPNGSVNVVPGRCLLSLDIRAGENGIRDAAVSDVMTRIQAICARRGVQVETELVLASDTVPCAPALQARFVRALERLGVPVRHLPSGAGHDAVEMSRIADVAMLFVRCGNGGISHNPLETATAEDLDLAVEAFRDTLDGLAADEWRRVAELDRMRT